MAVLSAVFYAPVAAAAVLFWQAQIGWLEIGFMAGSAAFHTGYFVLLNEGYRGKVRATNGGSTALRLSVSRCWCRFLYILVLTAMKFTPVSYVAPAREISILIGTAMGTRLLSEGDVQRRLAAAGAMVLGVVALVVG